MIIWFNDTDKNSIELAGGKGANLGEMVRNDFPVPPGFCISTEAYREHISKLTLKPYMELLSTAVLKEDMNGLNEAAAKVRIMIEDTIMAEPAEQKIRNAYRELAAIGTPLVSVRSSATAEDLPTASFAGQQETFLSVSGEEQLLKYVKKCWASLWVPRSISYRQKHGFAHEKVALAVVVQSMVQSEKSGVLFTINPISGSIGEMMINASYGLGESVVSGRVTPDTFLVSKKGKQFVIDKQLGSKETQIITRSEGLTVETGVPVEMRSRFCLDEAELSKLRDLGVHVEGHYGKPQDIEWAIVGQKPYLLQARPITTAPASNSAQPGDRHESGDKPEPGGKLEKTRKLSKMQRKILDNFKEHIPDAPYPLDHEPLLLLNEQKNAVFRELGITMPAERKMVLMNEKGVLSVGRLLPHPNICLLLLPVTLRRMLRFCQTNSMKEMKNGLLHELTDLESINISLLDNNALSDYILRAVDIAMKWTYLRFRAYVFPMIFSGFFLNRIIRKAGQPGQSVNQYDFLAGLDYKTAEIERALYHLADRLDKTTAVRQLFLEISPTDLLQILNSNPENHAVYSEFSKFLKAYGARTMKAYTPFSAASWSEHPELLIGTLASILKAGNIQQHLVQMSNGEKKYNDLKGSVISQLSKAKRKRFEHILEQFRSLHSGREELVYRMEQCFVAARHGVTEAAKRLCRDGKLSAPEDIRYFTLSELKQVLMGTSGIEKLCKTASSRKEHRYMAEQAWNEASAERSGVAVKGSSISGLSGSPGIARGQVRIIHDPEEFSSLQKGEVLVCRFTDPVWTPLFSVACAIVCDTGGPLSHAAIVAREYGMPAVLGTGNATTVLQDGDAVIVDGTKGTVTIISREDK